MPVILSRSIRRLRRVTTWRCLLIHDGPVSIARELPLYQTRIRRMQSVLTIERLTKDILGISRRCKDESAHTIHVFWKNRSYILVQRTSGTSVHIPWRLPFFSLTLVCRIFDLMRSFWICRCSILPHHNGRLYSHFTQRLIQFWQAGWPSSHFFLRTRHVKQPVRYVSPSFTVVPSHSRGKFAGFSSHWVVNNELTGA